MCIKDSKTIELYKDDPYIKTFQSQILAIGDNWIKLDKTIFYAEGGGQLGDKGILKYNNREIVIINTIRDQNIIKHVVREVIDLKIGNFVKCVIDWERRYRLMKIHTCLHLLCSLIDAKVTGGSVSDGKGRLDFNLDYKPSKEELNLRLNNLIKGNHDVSYSFINEKQLDQNPDLVKTMSVQPPKIDGEIRMVKIGDHIDYQPCGGTHVKNTSEIGLVVINKVENKGKINKRVVVSLL